MLTKICTVALVAVAALSLIQRPESPPPASSDPKNTSSTVQIEHRFHVVDATTLRTLEGVQIDVALDSQTHSGTSNGSGLATIALPNGADIVTLRVSDPDFLEIEVPEYRLIEVDAHNVVSVHPRSTGYTSSTVVAATGGTISLPNGGRIVVEPGDLSMDCALRVIEVPFRSSYLHTLDHGALLAHLHLEAVDAAGNVMAGAIASDLSVIWPSPIAWAGGVSGDLRAWRYDPSTSTVTDVAGETTVGQGASSFVSFEASSEHNLIRWSRTYAGDCAKYKYKATTLPGSSGYMVSSLFSCEVTCGTSYGTGESLSVEEGSTEAVTSTLSSTLEADLEATIFGMISIASGGNVTRSSSSTITNTFGKSTSASLLPSTDLGPAYGCYSGTAHVGLVYRVVKLEKQCIDPAPPGEWEQVGTFLVPANAKFWLELEFDGTCPGCAGTTPQDPDDRNPATP